MRFTVYAPGAAVGIVALVPDRVVLLPPIDCAGRVICAGIHYADQSVESGMAVPV